MLKAEGAENPSCRWRRPGFAGICAVNEPKNCRSRLLVHCTSELGRRELRGWTGNASTGGSSAG